eukprot:6465117-Amphidinium_carterae.1
MVELVRSPTCVARNGYTQSNASGRRCNADLLPAKLFTEVRNNASLQSAIVSERIQGFSEGGVDTFANTAARTTQRIICSCAALFNWKLTALDVSTVFLQGLKYGDQGRVIHLKLDAEITTLLRELPGFEHFDNNTEVVKLPTSAYGLVDAPKRWFESFTLALKEANWKATLLVPALYHHNI